MATKFTFHPDDGPDFEIISTDLATTKALTMNNDGDLELGGADLAHRPPLAIFLDADTGGPSVVFVDDVRLWEFPDGSTKGISGMCVAPTRIDLALENPTIVIPLITSSASAANNVVIQATMRYIAVGEGVDKAADQTLSNTVAAQPGLTDVALTTFTLNRALIAADDIIYMHLERLGTAGADNFGGSVAVPQLVKLNVKSK